MLLVCFLVATAITKWLTLSELLRGGGLLSDTNVLSIAIGFELAAAAMIALASERVAHRVAVATFGLLALVAGFAWWTQQDCNCFGPRTPRGVPFLIDLLCLGALAWVRPSKALVVETKATWTILLAALLFVVGGGGTWVMANRITSAATMPMWFGDQLVGTRFPLLQLHSVQHLFPIEGDLTVFLLRPDCDHCREFATEWNAAYPPDHPHRPGVVGVSISPGQWTVMPGIVSATVVENPGNVPIQWSAETEPFVAAPTRVNCVDGLVVKVTSGDELSL